MVQPVFLSNLRKIAKKNFSKLISIIIRWTTGNPDNSGGQYYANENCIEIYNDGKMNDLPCSSKRKYICESNV